jgi:hypothetical protein
MHGPTCTFRANLTTFSPKGSTWARNPIPRVNDDNVGQHDPDACNGPQKHYTPGCIQFPPVCPQDAGRLPWSTGLLTQGALGVSQDPLAPRRGPRGSSPDRQSTMHRKRARTSAGTFGSTVIPLAAHWVITPGGARMVRARAPAPATGPRASSLTASSCRGPCPPATTCWAGAGTARRPPRSGRTARTSRSPPPISEKDAALVQELGQLQPFIAVFPRECTGQLASLGPIEHLAPLALSGA